MVPRPEHAALLVVTHPGGGKSFDYEDYRSGSDLILLDSNFEPFGMNTAGSTEAGKHVGRIACVPVNQLFSRTGQTQFRDTRRSSVDQFVFKSFELPTRM